MRVGTVMVWESAGISVDRLVSISSKELKFLRCRERGEGGIAKSYLSLLPSCVPCQGTGSIESLPTNRWPRSLVCPDIPSING